MTEFLSTYGWNLLALLVATKALAAGYFFTFKKTEVTYAIMPLSVLLFLLVSFATFEQNISIGLGILGVLSFIRLRSSLDSLTDTVVLLSAVIFGILAAEISQTSWLVSAYAVVLILFGVTLLSAKIMAPKAQKTMSLTIDELVLLPTNTDRENFKKRLEQDFGIEVLQFEILSVDYVRDASKITITYLKP